MKATRRDFIGGAGVAFAALAGKAKGLPPLVE